MTDGEAMLMTIDDDDDDGRLGPTKTDDNQTKRWTTDKRRGEDAIERCEIEMRVPETERNGVTRKY